MPLFINGRKTDTPLNVDSFLDEYPHFKTSSESLLQQEVRVVDPRELLYVGQREVAATSPLDTVISVLGSEDATTCHIGVLRHTGSRATSLIHFDGCSTQGGLQTMISLVSNLTKDKNSGRLEFHVVGGFDDPRKISHDLSNEVFRALCESHEDIHLVTACITYANTTHKNGVPFPVIYGLAIDVKTGELLPATFPDKGPDICLRDARHFTGGKENILIYEPESHELVIGPFNYKTMQDVDAFLTLPDHLIRKYLSTSPEQEPEGFEANVRAALVQIRDFPQPLTSVFVGGASRRYRKDRKSGSWLPVHKA